MNPARELKKIASVLEKFEKKAQNKTGAGWSVDFDEDWLEDASNGFTYSSDGDSINDLESSLNKDLSKFDLQIIVLDASGGSYYGIFKKDHKFPYKDKKLTWNQILQEQGGEEED